METAINALPLVYLTGANFMNRLSSASYHFVLDLSLKTDLSLFVKLVPEKQQTIKRQLGWEDWGDTFLEKAPFVLTFVVILAVMAQTFFEKAK